MTHLEPFLHLAGLTHADALIAWGAFHFKDDGGGGRAIVEDRHLEGRNETIGVRSHPYGSAEVEVIALDTGARSRRGPPPTTATMRGSAACSPTPATATG